MTFNCSLAAGYLDDIKFVQERVPLLSHPELRLIDANFGISFRTREPSINLLFQTYPDDQTTPLPPSATARRSNTIR